MVKKDVQRTSTVFIRGLPVTTQDSVLSETFKEFGNIRQAFITKPKNSNSQTSIGYVKFTTIDEATSAISTVKTIGSNKVILSYARKKPRKYREPVSLGNKGKGSDSGLSDTDVEEESVSEPKRNKMTSTNKKNADQSKEQPVSTNLKQNKALDLDDGANFPKNSKTVYVQNLMEGLSENQLKKKFRKIGEVSKVHVEGDRASITYKDEETARLCISKLNNHVYKQKVISVVSSMLSAKAIKKRTTPSRIVIRNLSFKVTEELLRSELLTFGKMLDLSVPKNGEGKIRGFAFVSYINKFEANKALQKLNGKEILGRKVAVDWALSKDEYVKKAAKTADVKDPCFEEEEENQDVTDDENEDDDTASNLNDKEQIEENSDANSEDVSGSEDEEKVKPKKEYDDVKEGRTVFMGNLPFDVEKEDIEEAFSEFGSIRYVRMVYDHEKDRPKGIAFLQFDEKSDADSCLERVSVRPLCIGGRTIAVKKAVDSKQLTMPENKSHGNKGKDNRNLHLATEGIIKEGTNAAAGISKADIMKRKLALEAKKKKLKNINFFVSTDRLCVRNMPSTFSETDLKQLMSKYGHVVQVKIMRDIKQANSAGIGKSKGYGFVQFSKHEAALTALRATNNNPSIFTAQKRPIVDFSIENSGILNARSKKKSGFIVEEKSSKVKKSFNQRWKEKREKRKESGAFTKPPASSQSALSSKPEKTASNKKKSKCKTQVKESLGQSQSSGPKRDLKNDTSSSINTVLSSQPQKLAKRKKKGKSDRPNKKQKREKEQGEEAAFQKLVQNYKGKLESQDQSRSFKKWYDD
ncbi:hypothetical protein ACHWQZ_G013981 [Mnemiopsis leidyi]